MFNVSFQMDLFVIPTTTYFDKYFLRFFNLIEPFQTGRTLEWRTILITNDQMNYFVNLIPLEKLLN